MTLNSASSIRSIPNRGTSRRSLALLALVAGTVLAATVVSVPGTSAKKPIVPIGTSSERTAITPMVACPEPQGWWEPLGDGLNAPAEGLAFDSQNNLYVGGEFTSAGGVAANRVAKWNGSAWSALGVGLGNPPARAFAFDSNDNVYVGGDFTFAGGAPADGIAKWNGSAWSALGAGLGSTWALATDSQNNLYAGVVAAGGVAKWNPSTSAWSALGGGVNNEVYALAVDSHDDVYVAGAFTQAGGTPANRIAKWNGTSWSALGDGLNGNARSIAIDSHDNVYVGGNFTTAGGNNANNIAKWDGNSWSPLSPGLNGNVRSIAIDNAHGLVYVAGAFTATAAAPIVTLNRITVWDTRTNQFIPLLYGCSPNIAGLSGVGTSVAIKPQVRNQVFVGGSFTDAGGNGAGDRVAMWTWGFPEPWNGQLVSYTAAVGSQVTVTGGKLIGVTGVQIGTTPVTNFTPIDSTTITMTVPSGLATGVPLNINVTAVGGTAAVATLTVPPPPLVPLWRVSADSNGGTCRGLTTPTLSFVGHGYLPGPDDCSRDGYTFAGWANTATPTTPVSFPLLQDPASGSRRYFVSANHDLIAVWLPLAQTSLPTPVVFGTGSFFCRVCTSAVVFWQEPSGTPVGTEWTVTSQNGQRGLVNSFGPWRFSIITGLTPGSTHTFTVAGRTTTASSTSVQVSVTIRNS